MKKKVKKKNLFFIYNNPDHILASFKRCQQVLNNPNIIKINLTTGNQSITGSTRMQATSSETFIIANLLNIAIFNYLQSQAVSRQFLKKYRL